MTKEKTLNNVPGYEGQTVIIKRMNYGDRSELAEKTTEIFVEHETVNGKKVPIEKVKVSAARNRIYTLVYGIKEAPFFSMADPFHRENAIKQLDEETGGYLLDEINKLNEPLITAEEKKE